MALAIPYSQFQGNLQFRPLASPPPIDPDLKLLNNYLKKLSIKNDFPLDIERFQDEIANGLIFKSSIPQGYGVGSSGALSAAIFDRYATDEIKKADIHRLKDIMSMVESFFHGSSSGLDPLISFLNKSILIKDMNSLNIVKIPTYNFGKGGIFLVNTNKSRKTAPLVSIFMEKCQNVQFNKLCETVLLNINNSCINCFMNGDFLSLYEYFRELSDFQIRHFGPMIPLPFESFWEHGLNSQQFYLKLCGAGGGGFLLGMTMDFDNLSSTFDSFEIRPLFRF